MSTVRRSKSFTGVLRRCSCPERSERCTHWTYTVELPSQSGKRRQLSQSGYRSATAASEARDELIGKHRRAELPADDRITVAEWIRQWLKERIDAGEIRPSTARSYKDLAEQHLLPRIGHIRLAKLRPADLTSCYRSIVADRKQAVAEVQARNAAWLKANPNSTRPYPLPREISPATVRRIHAVASGALTSARKGGLISISPAPDAELPEASRDKVEAWTPSEYATFLHHVQDHRLYAAFFLAGHTGLRRGELSGLKWADVDLAAGRLTVRRNRVSIGYAVVEGRAKSDNGHGRVVTLSSGTREVLMAHAGSQVIEREAAGPAYEDGDWLICDELGRPVHPELLTKTFQRLVKRTALPSTKFHGLRHFFAWGLVSTGRTPAEVAYLMGDTIDTVMSVYGGLFEQSARDATQGVDDLVRGASVNDHALTHADGPGR